MTLDIEDLDFAAKTFFYTTKLSIAFVNDLGETILVRGPSGKRSKFCELLDKCTDGNCPCRFEHLCAGEQSFNLGQPYISICPAGLTYIAMAVTMEGVFKGFFISGGFLMTSIEEFPINDMFKKFHITDEIRQKEFKDALDDLPKINPALTRYFANAIECVTTSIMLKHSYELQKKNEQALQQRKINETIQEKKYIYNADYSYPFELEKSLIDAVKSGQTAEAASILNKFLGHILFSHGNDIDVIKPRVLELCTIISRVALESTKRVENTLSLNAIFLNELSKAKTLENLEFALQKSIKEFTDEIWELNNTAVFAPIRRAINYLHTYYYEEITLLKVAKLVHLTPSYFSTIFKKETGYSFTQYLNKIRIENGKLLLLDTSMSILEVAIEVGFDTDTYFCTVFKKIVGISPNQFRKAI
ncbi:MAG: hypothetical protein ATN31_00755 [Candidatus Epulonipiscioides saccharophilum]|nr:MAG: hypothetical protein ATN31_00755 [Epulopiscium sp. AS2M-Bin001]